MVLFILCWSRLGRPLPSDTRLVCRCSAGEGPPLPPQLPGGRLPCSVPGPFLHRPASSGGWGPHSLSLWPCSVITASSPPLLLRLLLPGTRGPTWITQDESQQISSLNCTCSLIPLCQVATHSHSSGGRTSELCGLFAASMLAHLSVPSVASAR